MFGSTIDNAISDFFHRPFNRTYKPGDPHTLPIMGITVSQADYDTLKTECDRERKSAQHWYEKYMKIETDLRERIAKRDELITKLANDLQEANETIEKMSIEIDTLQKRLARRKQSPRETGVK